MKNNSKKQVNYLFPILLALLVLPQSFISFASDLNKSQIAIITVDGNFEYFDVECAISNAEKTKGLMFRERLDINQGMLFIWESDALRQFWMKNTLIDLDILFINSENEIVNIEERAQSGSIKILSSKFPAKYVLEINAGQSQMRNITPGAILGPKKLYDQC